MRSRQVSATPHFYVGMALVGLTVVIAGFSKTFLAPLAAGAFRGSAIVYLHGAAAFGWVLLFLAQASLIRTKRFALHARAGFAGLVLALTVAASAVPVGLYAVDRDLRAGLGATAVSSLVGTVTAMVIFLGLVAAAIAFRRRPAAHKRLMLMATIVVLWPAWFRLRHWFPGVPHPEIWFAVVAPYSLVPLAMVRDRLIDGRIHPIWWFVGVPVVVEQAAEALLFDSAGWRAVASSLYGWLS
jgi:hypothetical protein